jgi:RND family efflux transporter MFP subunit
VKAVEAEHVRRTTIEEKGVFTGSVIPRAHFVVAPKVAGRLEKLTVDIGDVVTRGKMIAVLEDAEYAQGVAQARAELKVAEANVAQSRSSLKVAQSEFDRARALNAKNIASESELDSARSRYEAEAAKHEVAKAEVARREAALKAAQIRLSYTKIHATWESDEEERVVGERFVHGGAMLSPNTPIVTILDISTVIAVVQVIERDYGKIRPGQAATIETDVLRERRFAGSVARVAPLLKESSRQARVEIEIDNPRQEEGGHRLLKPGMFVRATIVLNGRADATVVPHSAIRTVEGREGVFLVDERSIARFVPVRTGIRNVKDVEIVEPSLEGLVVTLEHKLRDGDEVKVVRSGGTGAPPVKRRTVEPGGAAP